MSDRDDVWKQMAIEHPEFTQEHDVTDNHHAVREIVLGGSLSWAGVHSRFTPGPGKWVMDVGANAGIFATYCALKGANVVAYEPFKLLFDKYEAMIERTGLGRNIAAINEAVWSYTGECPYVGNVSLLEGTVTAYNGGVPADGITENFSHAPIVKCVSFEDAIGDQIWDCVKMDIEGAEFETILATPDLILGRVRFMYIEFHPWACEQLYWATLKKLAHNFVVDGVSPRDNGRWEAAYLTSTRGW